MDKFAYISHPIYMKHNTGPNHPESENRLVVIESHLNNSGFFKKIVKIEPEPTDEKLISIAHKLSYIQKVKSAIYSGETVLDHGDTVVCEHSFKKKEVSKHAIGFD